MLNKNCLVMFVPLYLVVLPEEGSQFVFGLATIFSYSANLSVVTTIALTMDLGMYDKKLYSSNFPRF